MSLTQVDQGLLGQYAQYTGFKNKIINGQMQIDQRNAGASITPATGAYTLDRWCIFASQASKFTIQQNAGSVTPPNGFTNYLGLTVGASANVTVGAGDYFLIDQVIEGFNLADLGWGTTAAQTVTLSFWVRSSLTGTFGGSVKAYSGSAYGYPFTYTINTANTWEQKTITIAGPTSTWAASTTNGGSAEVIFSVGTGSTYTGSSGSWQAATRFSATGATNLISTNSATFYITGVQLEKGSTATSFDYRPYGTELALCQRYYEIVGETPGSLLFQSYAAVSSESSRHNVFYKQNKRAVPTVTFNGTWTYFNASGIGLGGAGIDCSRIAFLITSAGQGYAYAQTSGANITFSAEL